MFVLAAPGGSFNGATPSRHHRDYVSIMLAVTCLLLAAAWTRCTAGESGVCQHNKHGEFKNPAAAWFLLQCPPQVDGNG